MSLLTTITLYSLSVLTLLGVVLHDTHVDKAAATAIALPVLAASAGAAVYISSSEHTHVERIAFARHSSLFRSTLPKIQPPRDDDRRYVLTKRLYMTGGGDQSYLWPSV